MTKLLISPAEHSPLIKSLGQLSPLPEQYGSDVLWCSEQGEWVGVQRKELMDLIASLHDNRLTKELIQMAELDIRILIIEGQPRWGPDGTLLDRYARWSRKGHHNLIQSLSASGISVHQTLDTQDTSYVISGLVEWTDKDSHSTLMSRSKNVSRKWGEPSAEEWQLWILQSFPGISITRAKQIIQHFGTIPLRWTATEQELSQVPGIGKLTASRLRACLASSAGSTQSDTSSTGSPDSSYLSAPSISTTTPSSRGSRKRVAKTSQPHSAISISNPSITNPPSPIPTNVPATHLSDGAGG